MTRITNTDQVLNLIRAELQKMDRTRRSKLKPGQVASQDHSRSPLERLFSAEAFHALSEEEQHRAFIRGIMTEAFGASYANDARFISIAGNIYEALTATDDGRNLIRKALASLNG